MTTTHSADPDTTRTQDPGAERRVAEQVVGILWVAPRERFDAFECTELGRAEDCGIALNGSEVSRRHARLEREGPLWVIVDLDSKNGTWVNARRERVAALDVGNTLRVGDWVGVVCAMPKGALDTGELFVQVPPALLASAPTYALLEPALRLARRDVPLVLYGDTGSGKDAVARAIHHASGRPGRLVAVNCAALPEALAEGVLFGHKRGAFTGAQSSAEGYVRAAHRGTLFLDEIADLPLGVQAKLLRALEERAVTPLGTSEPEAVDFRLIAACQVPLAQLCADGAFRADLHARLSGLELSLSPLSARRQEVPRLFAEFWRQRGLSIPRSDSRFVEALCVYDWPYNVRELRQLAHVLAHDVETAEPARLTLDDLPQRILQPRAHLEAANGSPGYGSGSARRKAWLSRHARELDALRRCLDASGGNVSVAALAAGVPRHRARRLLAAEAEIVNASAD